MGTLGGKAPSFYAIWRKIFCPLVAVGMIFGDAGLLQFTEQTLADNRVIEPAQRVAYVINPEDIPKDYVGWLEVLLKLGLFITSNSLVCVVAKISL